MNERLIATAFNFPGTLTGNVSAVMELPYPWTFKCVKACASNDSSATLALSGGVTVSATAIGDSGDPTEIAATAGPTAIDADESLTLTLDYDGSSGTAGQNVSVVVIGWVGDSA